MATWRIQVDPLLEDDDSGDVPIHRRRILSWLPVFIVPLVAAIYMRTSNQPQVCNDITDSILAADKYNGMQSLYLRLEDSRDQNLYWTNFFRYENKGSLPLAGGKSSTLRLLERHVQLTKSTSIQVKLLDIKLRELEAGTESIISVASAQLAEAERAAAVSVGWNNTLTKIHPWLPYTRYAPYPVAVHPKVIARDAQLQMAYLLNNHTEVFTLLTTTDANLSAHHEAFNTFLNFMREMWTQPLETSMCLRARLQKTCSQADLVRANDRNVYDKIERLLRHSKEQHLIQCQKDREILSAIRISFEDIALHFDRPFEVETYDDAWQILHQLDDRMRFLVMIDEDGDRKFGRMKHESTMRAAKSERGR